MEKLRVLVVEDSLTIRRRLCEVLSADADIGTVVEAADGARAIELCRELRPHVVSLDMVLPVMSGLAVTEYLMAFCPTPILIVSASVNRGEVFKTFDALAAGAVDVFEKPRGDGSDEGWERAYVAALKRTARIKVITHLRGRLEAHRLESPPSVGAAAPAEAGSTCRIVAIGASTGGPGALVDILRSIPVPVPVPIAIVLHLDETFGTAFADWLDGQTQHGVYFAREGESLAECKERVVMAPPGRHLVLRGGRFHLTDEEPRHSCRPSIDVMFESVAADCGKAALGCLLTGMGQDGAQGLLRMRGAGAVTIAQDEASSVVYGMPREAARLGAASRILPLAEIGPWIAVQVRASSRSVD